MQNNSLKTYKKISDKKIRDVITYLSIKYSLPREHVEEIVLKRQFAFAKGRLSSGYWKDVRIRDFGVFKFNKRLFDRHFQRVCSDSEKEQQRLQTLLIQDDAINKSK